jgi:predicted dehydrogenase
MSRVIGANDRIRLGFIGVANRGRQDLAAFLKHQDAEVVALADVSQSTLEETNQKFLGGKAAMYGDFRQLIDRQDIDGVVIATPDHWHAIMTISACNAGKDVYCEKPLSITIYEGRRMVEAARRNNRVVTVGLHRRSAPLYIKGAELVRSGGLGPVTVSRAYHRSNMFPNGIGHEKPADPPKDLNWDMWLGPRPARPFQANIAPYKFRWWNLYSSQTANNGVHFLDSVRWFTGDLAPTSICAMGGKFVVDDDRTISDTEHVSYQFPQRMVIFGMYESSGNRTLPREGYFEIRGTDGTLYCTDSYYEVIPEKPGQFQEGTSRGKAIKVEMPSRRNASHTELHARNFLDCMRSRQKPNCDVEEGHRSTTMALLAKISLATRSRLEWDPVKEQITNHPEANSMLHYEYRAPWKLE